MTLLFELSVQISLCNSVLWMMEAFLGLLLKKFLRLKVSWRFVTKEWKVLPEQSDSS